MISIRPARKDEIQKLQDLNDQVFVHNSEYDPDIKIDWAQSPVGKSYFTEVVNNPEEICLIAEENDIPVGYIAAGPKEFDYRNSKYIEIENMGVSPEHRSKGIGAQLIKKIIELAKEKGYQKVFVNSYSGNTKAVEFYERNGFNKIDISLEKSI